MIEKLILKHRKILSASILLLLSYSLQAQNINKNSFDLVSSRLQKDTVNFKTDYTFIARQASGRTAVMNVNKLPQNYYSKSLGFFCKKELAIEKATNIPLRLRVGSLSYCNQLEGKNR